MLRRQRDYYPTPEAKLLVRKAFAGYLHGQGIEIGALHQPLPLNGTRVTGVRYVDCASADILRQHYPELAHHNFAAIDVIDDGEKLNAFESASLDFIIANHFIEHARNPIGTLRAWLQRLRPEGIIYLAVPDKRFTFDVNRPLTSLQHLVDDDQAGEADLQARDDLHYVEFAEFVHQMEGDALVAHTQKLKDMNYSIHFHTYTPASFFELLSYLQARAGLPFSIAAYAETLPTSEEFLAVLKKDGG
jgi:predicted SAM-dependent methyltransferase